MYTIRTYLLSKDDVYSKRVSGKGLDSSYSLNFGDSWVRDVSVSV